MEKDAPYVFRFDLAIEPEFELKLNKRDKVEYFDITVDDKLIDQQVEMFSRRFGKMDDKAESYDAEANDLLQGDLRQLDAEGNTIEGGLTLEAAKLMPSQIKVEAQRDLFKGAKLGDIITFNPRNAYPESDGEMAALLKVEKDQLADYTGDFSFLVALVGYRLAEDGQFVVGDVLLHLLAQKLVDDVHLDGVAHLTTDQAHRHLARMVSGYRVSRANSRTFPLHFAPKADKERRDHGL